MLGFRMSGFCVSDSVGKPGCRPYFKIKNKNKQSNLTYHCKNMVDYNSVSTQSKKIQLDRQNFNQ